MKPIIHLSIDDVWKAFDQLFTRKPDTIFAISLFKLLRHYHSRDRAAFTLYVVGKTASFDLNACDTSYRDEFEKNADWLGFALHCVTLSDDSVTAMQGYEESFQALERVVGRKSISSVVRLHGFQNGALMKGGMENARIKTLLCADDDRRSYEIGRAHV